MGSAGHSSAVPLVAARGRTARAADVLPRVLGAASLATVIATSLHLVTAAATYPLPLVPARLGGLPAWLRGPLSGPGYVLLEGDFAWAMMAMTVAYLVALACTSALRDRWLIATVVAAHVIFLLGPPLLSSDVFGYLDWARMGVLHGLNPYSTQAASVVSDPVYGFVRWHTLTSPYGPLFTLATYALVPLGLPGSLWAFKLVVTLSSLGCAALIWRCARALGRSPRAALALYGLNPAVLVYTLGGFHNDAIMTVMVMAAVYLAVTGRERAGVVMSSLAVAVKSSAGLVIPFLILGASDRRRALVTALAAGAAVLALALAAFRGQAFDFIDILGTQQTLNSGSSVPAQLGAVFGWTGSPIPVRVVASALGVAAMGFFVARAWRGADWIEQAAWATLSLMVTSSWLLAWYIIWLVPLAALGRGRGVRLGAVAMTVFVVLVRTAPDL
jgi:Glycosyltransferase family 87